MNARVIVPLLVMLLVGYFVWDQYQQGRVALPGIQPVASPAASPAVTTTTTTASSNSALEPIDFVVKSEQKKALELMSAKSYAESLTVSDAWLRRNPTDALIGLERENAIVELSNSGSYTIGVSAPLTGALKQVGEAFLQGVLLAVRQVNSSGGLRRDGTVNRIKVRVLNDAGDRAAAIKVASEFAKDQRILGVVGPYSSSTLLAAAPIYNNSTNVIIAPAATNPRISSAGANIYRVAPSDATQGASLARLVLARGNKSVAVLFDADDAYSSGLAASFKTEARTIGLVTSDTPFTLNGYNVAKVGNYAVDAIFVAGYTNDVAAVAKLEKGFGKQVFAGDGAYGQDLIAQGGNAVEGVIVTSFWHSTLTDANSKRFTAQFSSLFGGGTPNANAMQAYDAARTLIEGLRRAKQLKSGADVRVALETMRLQPSVGVTAPVRFDANGDVIGRPWVAIAVKRNSSGKLTFQAVGYAK